jgi:hypothetical protein
MQPSLHSMLRVQNPRCAPILTQLCLMSVLLEPLIRPRPPPIAPHGPTPVATAGNSYLKELHETVCNGQQRLRVAAR